MLRICLLCLHHMLSICRHHSLDGRDQTLPGSAATGIICHQPQVICVTCGIRPQHKFCGAVCGVSSAEVAPAAGMS